MVAMIILLVVLSGFLGAIFTAAMFAEDCPVMDRESELFGKAAGIALLTLSLGVVVAWLAQ